MNPIQILSYTIAPFVILRRTLVGPRRKTWDLQTEVMLEVMRRGANFNAFLPLQVQRAVLEPPRNLVTRAMKQVKQTPVDAYGVPCEWFEGPDAEQDSVLVYYHGGAYVFCSLNSHRDLMCRLALATGMRVLGVDYRLAPEHPYPAQVEDSLHVMQWLQESEGIDLSNVVVAGESAGAGLSVATMVALRDSGKKLPGGAVLVSGWYNVASVGETMKTNKKYDYIQPFVMRHFARKFTDPRRFREPLASPMFADLQGLPPMLIQAGECETLLSDSVEFAEKARQAGVDVTFEIWPDMPHAFPVLAHYIPKAAAAIEKAGSFVRRMVGTRATSAAE